MLSGEGVGGYYYYGDIDPSPTKAFMIHNREDLDVEPLYDLAFGKRPREVRFMCCFMLFYTVFILFYAAFRSCTIYGRTQRIWYASLRTLLQIAISMQHQSRAMRGFQGVL